MVVATDADVRNEPAGSASRSGKAPKPKKAKPNPARWVSQADGRFRWWNGEAWTDYFAESQGEPDPTIPQPPASELVLEQVSSAPLEPRPSAVDVVEQLKQLAQLRDLGIITEAEFSDKKTELLGRM
ncbi:SHOCT domain-containing protein [Microcella flavibacter]|uniref:SHOCT domain-containing protein n=1 Tax=Microcella flavibacter TaxID=1804990 RepID=UPI0014572157|nr:SHOCT domain-containing protein [Microcella flavibacter]